MTDQSTSDSFTLPKGKTLFQAPPLTRKSIDSLLAAEPKAVVRRDDDMQVIGVDLPLPDGMTYSDGSATVTALLGDRVCRGKYGHWLVAHATP
jgi:hypothetical protein